MTGQLFNYIEKNFPDLESKIHLRFELGAPYENGSIERMNLVVERVTTLFEEVFKPEDSLYVYIKDWEIKEDSMFGNHTPDYVYELLENHDLAEHTLYELDEDLDEITGKPIELKREYKVRISYAQLKSIPYKEILEGIGHYEQGRDPSIGQSV